MLLHYVGLLNSETNSLYRINQKSKGLLKYNGLQQQIRVIRTITGLSPRQGNHCRFISKLNAC